MLTCPTCGDKGVSTWRNAAQFVREVECQLCGQPVTSSNWILWTESVLDQVLIWGLLVGFLFTGYLSLLIAIPIGFVVLHIVFGAIDSLVPLTEGQVRRRRIGTVVLAVILVVVLMALVVPIWQDFATYTAGNRG